MKIIKNFKSFLNENKTESIESAIKDPKTIELGQKVAQDPKALKAIMDELNKNGIDMELIKKAGQNIIDGKPLTDEMKAEIEKIGKESVTEGVFSDPKTKWSRIKSILGASGIVGTIGAGVGGFMDVGSAHLHHLDGTAVGGINMAIMATIAAASAGYSAYKMMKNGDKEDTVIYKELEKFINLSLKKFNNDKQKTLNFVTGCIKSGDFDFWLTHTKTDFFFNGIRVSSNENGYDLKNDYQNGELNNLWSKSIEILGMPSDTTFYPESAFKNKLDMVERSHMNSREDVERVLFSPEKSEEEKKDIEQRKKELMEKNRLARQEYLNSKK